MLRRSNATRYNWALYLLPDSDRPEVDWIYLSRLRSGYQENYRAVEYFISANLATV